MKLCRLDILVSRRLSCQFDRSLANYHARQQMLHFIPRNALLVALKYLNRGIFDFFSVYCIQHCFICRPSDSTVSEDAVIEPRTVPTLALAVRRSNH
jgi:hypothetical protein